MFDTNQWVSVQTYPHIRMVLGKLTPSDLIGLRALTPPQKNREVAK